MTFVPKIIFDICKRFFQLGHFTCDQGQDDFSIEAVQCTVRVQVDYSTKVTVLVRTGTYRTRTDSKYYNGIQHTVNEVYNGKMYKNRK